MTKKGLAADTTAFDLIDDALYKLNLLFLYLEDQGNLTSGILSVYRLIQEACTLDPDASLGSILLEGKRPYSVRHPVHVAIVCELFAKQMGWAERQRQPMVAAGLTMNIAILKLQDILYRRKGPLNAEEEREIKRHPDRGVEILNEQGISDPIWIDGVMHHHEAIDGSGYPHGLKGNAISLATRIITLADLYCAKVAEREYRPSVSPNVAMVQFFYGFNQVVDLDLATLLVKTFGIYPPGVLARLKNREIGMVTHRGKAPHCPIVHSILSPTGARLNPPEKRDCSLEEYTVKEILASHRVNVEIDPYELWAHPELSLDL